MIWRSVWILYIFFQCSAGFVLRFKQKDKTSTFNYTKDGLIISLDEDKSRCMVDLGCFSASGPFFNPHSRPVSLLPQWRHQLGTAFLLHTRRYPHFFRILTPGVPATFQHFLLGTETKVIVPGWTDNIRRSSWMQDMKDALLNYGDINVIIVEWSKSNSIPLPLAVANARVVGAEIALLINYMKDVFGVESESFHIIGHSLGSEIAGYAGERIKKLGRITALDPAGPYFRNVSAEVRLDPSDALFVDAIHTHGSETDLEKPGRLEQTGHIDFYPNGGEFQPGCSNHMVDPFVKKGTQNVAHTQVVCDQFRAIEYFMATIPNHYGCQPVGVACDSWLHFESGRCSDCGVDGSQCVAMGFGADIKQNLLLRHSPKKFYLMTSEDPPFCVQQYHVSLKLQDSTFMKDTFGEIFLELKGRFGTLSVNMSQRKRLIERGGVYKTVVTSPEDIGVVGVVIRWSCSTLRITENIQIDLDHSDVECKLFLHSIFVTTFTTSPVNPGKQLIICGSNTAIPPGVNVTLSAGTHCTKYMY